MADYTGSKCISCGKTFDKGDDIVVCPDCGTPYHRECYFAEGRCINDKLHRDGLSWQPEKPETEQTAAAAATTVRCIRCGADNPAENDICEKCGTPLLKGNTEERPFNQMPNSGMNGQMGGFAQVGTDGFGRVVFNQDSEIDGVKLGDYARYVGKNPLGFLPNFIRFGIHGGKLSMNIGAFFFTSVYFLYRKMKGWGIMAVIVLALLDIPYMIYYLGEFMQVNVGVDIKSNSFQTVYDATSFLTLVVRILAGFFANYLYYKQAKKDITDIRSDDTDDDLTANMKISVKGGTSWPNVIAGFMAYSMINMGAVIAVGRIMQNL